jgi:hypothetical protein
MEEYTLAYTIDGALKAQTLCTLLQSFGIQAIQNQESAGMAYGLTIGPLGEAKIYVPKSQLQAAQEILEAWERGETALPDDKYVDDPLELDE